MVGSDYCFAHNGEVSEKRKEAVTKGGRHKKKTIQLNEITILSTNDVLTLLNHCINEVRTGKLDTKTATSLGYLAHLTLEVLKITEVEKRLQEIENAIKLRERNK